jgi:putative membrane protein
MTTKHFLSILCIISCGSLISCSPKGDDSKKDAEKSNDMKFESDLEKDTDFAVEATDGGMLEVQLGQLAQTNGSNPEIKSFGKMMVDDHSKANEELKNLATKKNISIPVRLSDKNQDKYNDFLKKTGKDFDEAYAEFMVKDHKEDIDNFKKEADKGNDPDIKAWASNKVPTLEHHLDMAEQAERVVKGKENRTSLHH